MLKNYLKVTFRNMAKYRGYSFINIVGLTVGIAVCLLLFLWVNDELSYDKFHQNSDRIYRSLWKAKYGDNEWEMPLVPVPLAELLENEFPEVEWATQIIKGGYTFKKGGEYVREKKVLFVDEDFFKVFTVENIAGSPSSVIADPGKIILTEESAERYFGADKNIIGHTIMRNDGKEVIVGAIVKSFPEQSHLEFDFLASLKTQTRMERRKEQWGSATCLTYFSTNNKGDETALENKLDKWVDDNLMNDEFWQQGNNYTSFPFESVTDIHLKNNRAYIWIFGIIALFILVVAAINFINLATARSLTRAREVGVRKVLGSSRKQLTVQFFSEAFIYVSVSVCLAIFLAETILPYFNEFSEKNLEINLFNSSFIWLLLIGLLFFTTLLTGAFPAAVLSAFRPAKVLKGNIAMSGGKSRMRRGLVVFQFCISVALIIGTLVVQKQMEYMQSADLGFDQEHILVIKRATALKNNYDPFIEQVRKMPVVERVSISQYLPGDGFDSTIFLPEQPSNYQETSLAYTHIDPHFVDALKLKIADGRNFDLNFQTDSTAFLINQTAAEKLGWKNPVGKKLSYGGRSEGRVVGVVEDFNFSSLHYEIEPIILRMAQWKLSNIVVRLNPGNVNEQLSDIQKIWKDMAPQAPIEYTFLDQEFQRQYEKEQRMSKVFLLFAGLSIFIACLGLFGLAAFMAAQRTKEIGIRKILGATTAGIVGLLSKDFLKLVFLSLLIASPVAYYFMNIWLADFAYRIDIQWWMFGAAGTVAILVSLFTVGFQSVKAALANPVESLRNE